jgi:sugar phosphate isomerase/epimerase
MKDPGIGIAVNCREHERYLPRLAHFGYSYVHCAGFMALEHPQLRVVAEECGSLGLRPFSAHGPSVFLPNRADALEEMIGRHREAIDKAAVLGAGRITFHAASVEGVRDSQTGCFVAEVGPAVFEEMNTVTLRAVARHAAARGMRVALENRDQGQVADYCKTVGSLERMIDLAGEPNIGICLDSGHAHTHPDLDCARMIEEAGDLLVDTHFHDNFGQLLDGAMWGNGVVNDLHRPPGIGTIDWLAVIDALERIGYPNPVMFEVSLHTDDDDLDTLLRLTRDNWRLMIEAWRYVEAGRARQR